MSHLLGSSVEEILKPSWVLYKEQEEKKRKKNEEKYLFAPPVKDIDYCPILLKKVDYQEIQYTPLPYEEKPKKKEGKSEGKATGKIDEREDIGE
ncbi:UNVERIFIED_CONTAM: hypothetical protein RMT77_009081 [Armadillidium vulgare]